MDLGLPRLINVLQLNCIIPLISINLWYQLNMSEKKQLWRINFFGGMQKISWISSHIIPTDYREYLSAQCFY